MSSTESGIPTATVDTLVGTWHDIIDLLDDIDEGQWKQSSDLPGWTVQDIVSHLIGTERMLQGLPAAPAGTTEQPWVKNPIGDFNENDVELRRQRPGADVLTEWKDLVALREATLASGDADYFAQPMVNPTGPGTLADFLAVRILDCWIHEQDLRRTLDMPGGLAGPAAEHTIDRLMRTVPIVVGKRAACPEGRAVRLVITGGVERDVVCEVNGGRAGLVTEPSTEPLATITIGVETFARLANGRPPSPDDDVTIDGDDALGRAFVTNLNMMI